MAAEPFLQEVKSLEEMQNSSFILMMVNSFIDLSHQAYSAQIPIRQFVARIQQFISCKCLEDPYPPLKKLGDNLFIVLSVKLLAIACNDECCYCVNSDKDRAGQCKHEDSKNPRLLQRHAEFHFGHQRGFSQMERKKGRVFILSVSVHLVNCYQVRHAKGRKPGPNETRTTGCFLSEYVWWPSNAISRH